MTTTPTPIQIDPAAARAKLVRLHLATENSNNIARELGERYRGLVAQKQMLEARALPVPPDTKPTGPRRSRVASAYVDTFQLRELPLDDWRARYAAEQEELAALDAAIEAVLARRDEAAATWAAQARVVANSRDHLARLTGKRIELF